MNNFENRPDSQSVEPVSELNILARVNKVTEGDIQELKNRVLPEHLKMFENSSPDEILILTLFFKLSDDELKNLAIQTKKRGHVVGLHDVAENLFVLSLLTGDNKYKDICKIIADI